MSQRTRRYLPLLKQINRLGDRAKRQLIKKCDREFLDCVSECAKNVIKGNVPLMPAQLRRLRRERSSVRALALKKTSLKGHFTLWKKPLYRRLIVFTTTF